jgi:hypothetical protein
MLSTKRYIFLKMDLIKVYVFRYVTQQILKKYTYTAYVR